MANYINGVKLKKQGYGIKFSGKTADFIKQIEAITNEKGYFNLEINERKEVGQYGDTHSMKVDEWKPSPQTIVPKTPQGNNSLPEMDSLPF